MPGVLTSSGKPDIIEIRNDKGEQVIRIDHDGRLFRRGLEIETDEDFRNTMTELMKRIFPQFWPEFKEPGDA